MALSHQLLTYGNDVDEGGFPRVLETDKSQLHLLLPKEALEPLDYSVDERQHFEVCPELSGNTAAAKSFSEFEEAEDLSLYLSVLLYDRCICKQTSTTAS